MAVVGTAVSAAVSLAVAKIGEFLIQQLGLPKRQRQHVEWLKQELILLNAYRHDTAANHSRDQLNVTWKSEFESIANDAVDILKEYTSRSSQLSKFRATFLMSIFDDFIDKIETIKTRLLEISRQRQIYADQNNPGESSRSRRPPSHADEQDEFFVGLEDVFQELLNELIEIESTRRIVSIHGMGGLGKTTLARQLYHAGPIKNDFHNRAWVCVSQEYNIQELLRTVIKSFIAGSNETEPARLEQMNLEELEHCLLKFLRERKYLLVVDDVWSNKAWDSLNRALPDSENGSRIILTTRIKEVAERADNNTFVHDLRFLTRQESLKLFNNKISRGVGHANWCTPAMSELGIEMVKKCDGLPLAILVLGGLLSYKRTVEEWRFVRTHMWEEMDKDSDAIKDVILLMSYDNLSIELKQCFLYCGIFPEDYIFETEKLILLWMAEGFIPEGEDYANIYLQELCSRNLIQVVGFYRGTNFRCRMHDLLRDLAIKESRQVKFYNIYPQNKLLGSELDPRQVAVHSRIIDFLSNNPSNPKLRSLVHFNPALESIDNKMLTNLCKQFKSLRVLDLQIDTNQGVDFKIPDAIGGLTLLKFFGLLCGSANIILPSSIGKLKKLQTLQLVERAYKSRQYPKEISKLINLLHLLASSEGDFKFDTLTNLMTLLSVTYSQWVKNKVSNLINLRELEIVDIKNLGTGEYLLSSIGTIKSLESLALKCDKESSFPLLNPLKLCKDLLKLKLEGKIEKLPSVGELPQSLTVLTLFKSDLNDDPMPVLEKLPNLKNLRLDTCYNGSKMTCLDDGFLQLENLYFSKLYSLSEWELAKGAMPMLKGLKIMHCEILRNIPDRVRLIPIPKDSANNANMDQIYPFL